MKGSLSYSVLHAVADINGGEGVGRVPPQVQPSRQISVKVVEQRLNASYF